MDYWGGAKGMLAPPLKLLGGPGPPWPPSSYAYTLSDELHTAANRNSSLVQHLYQGQLGTFSGDATFFRFHFRFPFQWGQFLKKLFLLEKILLFVSSLPFGRGYVVYGSKMGDTRVTSPC